MFAFKVDENLPVELAALLRAKGHDALTVRDQNLGGRGDTEIADVCKSEGRALVTLDLGFANVRAYPPQQHPGIIVCELLNEDCEGCDAAAAAAVSATRSCANGPAT